MFDENGQRVLDKIVSFVGIAPMEDPEYIVLVALDTPSRETGIYISGGVMAAPTVGAVMADILPYLGVNKNTDQSREVLLEDFTDLTQPDAQSKLKELGLTAEFVGDGETVTGQLPTPGQTVMIESRILLYLGEEPEQRMVTIPDFTGMNRAQAADAAGMLGLYLRVRGNTDLLPQVTVTAQSLSTGMQVPTGSTITLEFTDTLARD